MNMQGGPQGSGSFERPREKMGVILRRLGKYLLRYKWLMALAVLMSLGGNLLSLVGPKLSGAAIDAIRPGPGGVDFPTVFYYAGLMLVFYAISSGIAYLLARLMIRLSRNVVFAMRKDVFDHLLRLPVSFFDTHQTGDVISRISYDIDTINASLSNDVVQMLASTVTIVGSFVMMLTISPRLLLIFAATLPISILFTRFRSRRVRPLYSKRSGKLGAMNGYVEEMTGGYKTTKAYCREETVIAGFMEKNEEAVESNYKAEHFACITGPTVTCINNLSLALISVFGALMYMAGGITLGNISSFVLYSRKFSGPINEFANIVSDLQSALAAAERVFRLLDTPPEQEDAPEATSLAGVPVDGDVTLDSVNFGYTREQRVLEEVSFTAEPGQVIAIVGPTGCGKTTVINLLMRFYDADSGSIRIEGLEIKGVTRDSLRRCYTMVLQDTWLFYGSIYENIAYGKENVTREEVEAAARAARIHSFITSLPQGYDTVLSDNGVNISKGQKQLLTIARAMLLSSPMLILDEATSNVDTRTEREIQAAMLDLMRGRTCFVIAHRLSTIQNADLILVMENGRILERGRHAELLQRRGLYYGLYAAQFEGE